MRFSFFLFSFAIAMILVSCQMAEAPESFPTSQNDITPIPSSNDGSQQTNSSYLSSRKLIRTGEVECETQDTGPLSDQIIQSAVNHEGFVSAQSSKYINERQVKDFSIQVPSSQFDMFMSEVQAILPEKAKVNIQSQDVTDQLVDLEARLQRIDFHGAKSK
ncbi:MAG: DUF4349 domain-containing protein [Flavobacteriales bacterium]|nr:DUF4349 domain-containing protein [Flavobacteriales bacterium]